MKVANLVFLLAEDDSQVLLAMKKKGFGAGKYNGVGGKSEPGETMEAAAVREAHEEVGVAIEEKHLEKCGEIAFFFEGKPDWDIHVTLYRVRVWSGEPVETDEMAPAWFSVDSVPYADMWIDDIEWLPQLLAGKNVFGEFHFDAGGDKILDRELTFTEKK